MSPRDVVEAEIRSTLAEMIGAARTVSESTGTLTRVAMRRLALELEDALSRFAKLVDQLP